MFVFSKIDSLNSSGITNQVGKPRDCGLPIGLSVVPFQRIASLGSPSHRMSATEKPPSGLLIDEGALKITLTNTRLRFGECTSLGFTITTWYDNSYMLSKCNTYGSINRHPHRPTP